MKEQRNLLIRQYRFTVIKLNKSKEDLEEAVLCQVRKMTDVLTEENSMRREMHKNGRKAVLETGKVYWAVKPNEREKGDMVILCIQTLYRRK